MEETVFHWLVVEGVEMNLVVLETLSWRLWKCIDG